MTMPRPPKLNRARRADLEAELMRRARSWLPGWTGDDVPGDAAAAIFKIAARLEAEVTQRLDRLSEKSFRGFLYWLGRRGLPGRAARLPVAFRLAPSATAVSVDPPIQIQATADDTPIVFETSTPLRLLPAQLSAVLAADPGNDTFYGPFHGLTQWEAPKSLPDAWRLVASASKGSRQLQLDPSTGLVAGETWIADSAGNRYLVTAVKDGIVSIYPDLNEARDSIGPGSIFKRIAAFDPFGPNERNRQSHAVYLGSAVGLDVKSPAFIEIVNAGALAGCAWHYWGKDKDSGAPDWVPLTKVPAAGGIYLTKEKGSIEPLKVGDKDAPWKESRWLRATPTGPILEGASLHDVGIRLNCPPEDYRAIDDKYLKPGPSDLKLEGIANTAPLVLNQPFYPLGREPRLFDAFYLGAEEAFSKSGAKVTISVEAGESFSGPIVSAALSDEFTIVAGVAGDKRLHVVTINDAGVPPRVPDFTLPPTQPVDTNGQQIALTVPQRPGAGRFMRSVYFTVAAHDQVWRWDWILGIGAYWWVPLGTPMADKPVTDTVLVDSGGILMVYAAAGGRLYKRKALAEASWSAVEGDLRYQNKDGDWETGKLSRLNLTRLAAVLDPEWPNGTPAEADGLVAVAETGELLSYAEGTWTVVRAEVDHDTYPLAVLKGERRTIFATDRVPVPDSDRHIAMVVAVDASDPEKAKADPSPHSLVGRSFSCLPDKAKVPTALYFGKVGTGPVTTYLWRPFDRRPAKAGPTRSEGDALKGAPVRHTGSTYVVAERGGVLALAEFGSKTPLAGARQRLAIVVDEQAGWETEQRLLVDVTPDLLRSRRMLKPEAVHLDGRRTVFVFDADLGDDPPPRNVSIYRGRSDDFAGEWDKDKQLLELTSSDQLDKRTLLYIAWTVGSRRHERVVQVSEPLLTDPIFGTKSAKLSPPLPNDADGDVTYRVIDPAEPHSAAMRLAIKLAAALPVPPEDAIVEVDDARHTLLGVLDDGKLLMTDGKPINPATQVNANLIAPFGAQTSYSPPRPRNPDLSWEFWDGQSWWQLEGVKDGTGNLVASGDIQFDVPPLLQANDVVGRRNYWVRARLVGGDYGQETITLVSTVPEKVSDTQHKQTVTRDPSSIRAPYIVSISVSYSLCKALSPDLVITEDGGGYRDQTDANTARNARVRIFTPLKHDLPRTGAQIAEPTSETDCGCETEAPESVQAASVGECDESGSVGVVAPDPTAETDRAVYLGFDKPLQGDSIAILLLVNDAGHDGAFPLVVEAYTDDGFSIVAADDGTLGLSQTGIVTLSLPQATQQVRFFGRLLHWLRLKPSSGFDPAAWKPQLRGIYLNAAFATAAETQRQEILGSSDGSPHQSVFVARPPVLRDSLELRIREPLDDDEVGALNEAAAGTVATELGPWKGAWVRWQPATLATSPAAARVFELEAGTGEIRFGDGRHGAIPPIGQNNIVAVTYQRRGDDTANRIAAWTSLNLVTPVAGVEATIAPEPAAGGANEQGAEVAMRFAPANVRMHDRALTLADIETLGLQSSPEIAQVKALRTSQGVRIIAVMRGLEPLPSNAARRELARIIVEGAPPALSTPGAVVVEPARLVSGRIDLALIVTDLAQAAAVTRQAIQRIRALLDPATGGIDGHGWPLGSVPDEADIAQRLLGIKELVDVAAVEITPKAPLRPIELLVVAADDIVVRSSIDEEVTV